MRMGSTAFLSFNFTTRDFSGIIFTAAEVIYDKIDGLIGIL
jgi:hypothetical protein